MAARPVWKGIVVFDDVRLPVKLYSAARDQNVHFRLLHAADMVPVRQQMVDPRSDEPVAETDVVRGVEVEEGIYVKVALQERVALEPLASRDIEISQVLAPGQMDVRWLDRPYYLGPDGDDEGYMAFSQALANRTAIAHWVMRKKRYHGAIRSRSGYLTLQTLHAPEELVPIDAVQAPAQQSPHTEELALARQLVHALADGFDPEAYQNTYRTKLKALIEAKAHGAAIEMPQAPPRPAVRSLAESLEKSLRATSGEGAFGG